jgi:hypothetical protein
MSLGPTPPLVSACLLAATALALCSTATRADIGVSLPAEATPEEAAAIEAAVRQAQKAPVRMFPAPKDNPAPMAPPEAAAAALERARKAYKNLEMDAARTELVEAEATCIAAGSCTACRDLLFDVHLLAGAIAVSLGEDDVGAAEFVTAHAVHPSRVVDPRRFPPKIVGAFNRACADMEKLPPTAFRAASSPAGATLTLNNAPIPADADVRVKSRRVYIEAHLAGFAPRCEALDAAAAGTSDRTIRLETLAADQERTEAALLLAARAPALDAPALAFLGRIGVDRFVALALAQPPNRFTARAARAGAPAWVELPPLAIAKDAASPQFAEALAAAVGEKTEIEAPPVPQNKEPPAEDPDSLDDEEEDDNVLLDPDTGGTPDNGTGTGSKVLRSPWLWISIGVVVAVVGGVVIGTQVDK